jgi:hypothetical protein
MAKLVKAILALVALYVVVMGGSGLLIRSMLAGGVGESLRRKAEGLLPVEVTIEGGDFDIAEWFFFRPAIAFDRLRVANPQGFSDAPLLEAERVAARANLPDLLGGRVAVRSVEIDAPRLLVETNDAGRTNVQALLGALRSGESDAGEPSGDGDGPSVSVGSFLVRDGEVRYTAPGAEPMLVRNLAVEIHDFDPETAVPLTVELDLFGESALHLRFEGQTGPFTPKSSPASGALTVEAHPGRLPESFRRQYMGDFLASPGTGAEVHLALDLRGDLLGVLVGSGALRVAGVQLGDPAVGQLPLSGEAPVMLTLIDPAANPSYDFVMPEAQFHLGAGEWRGGLQVQYDGDRVRGESHGAVSGVDINQMLSAFSDADDLLFGRLALRRYAVKFSGRNAKEIQRSLNGSGRLEVEDGKLALFDVLRTVEQKVMKAIGGEESYVEGVTSFLRLSTDFQVGGGRVTTPNLILENEQARVGGAGFFELTNDVIDLDYTVSSLITGALAAALGGEKNAQGEAQVAAPLRVSGNTKSPKVFLDLKAFAKQQAGGYAQRLLESLIKGKTPETPGAAEGVEAPAPVDVQPEAEGERPRLPFSLGGILDKTIQKAKDKIPGGVPSEPEAPQPR